MNASRRQAAILYELTFSKEPFQKCSDLCAKFNVCAKTIRSDIKVINDDFRDSGICIRFARGEGYRLEADSEQTLKELRKQFRYRFIDSQDVEMNLDRQEKLVLFCLFTANGYVRVDDIASLLNMNSRSVSSLLAKVRHTLGEYGISLSSRPHYGLYLDGTEINIRSCYVDTICFYGTAEGSSMLFEDSLSMVNLLEEEKQKVMEACLEFVKETGCQLSQIAIRKLIVLILISLTRHREGHAVVLSEVQRNIIDRCGEWLNSRRLIYRIDKALSCHISADEVRLISVFLICWVDYSEQRYRKIVPAGVESVADSYLQEMLRLLKQLDIVTASNSDIFREMLDPVMISMSFRSVLGVREQNPNSYLKCAVANSPLSASIGWICFRRLESFSGSRFGEASYVSLALAIYSCIRRTNNIRKKVRLALLTPAEKTSGLSLKRRILDRYSNIVQKIDVVTVCDLLRSDLSQYDYLVLFENETPLGLRTDIPQFHVDYYFTEEDVRNFYERISNPSRIYKNAFGTIRASDYQLDFPADSVDEIIAYLKKGTDDPQLLRQLSEFHVNSYLVFNGTLNIILFTRHARSTQSRLLVLKKPIFESGLRFRRVFFHVLKIGGDMIRLKTSEKVTRNLTTIEDTDQLILREPFIDFYAYYINLEENRLDASR